MTAPGPAERNVSMVCQSHALFPHMNAIADVACGLNVSGVAKDATRKRAHAAMATVGLSGFDERLPSELSGGQQQRLGLTVAYVTHDQSEALAVSDQIIVMDHGVIAQAGTPTRAVGGQRLPGV